MDSTTAREVIQHEDGRIELADYSAIEHSPLYSEDLAPVAVAKRNWTTYNFAALWMGMSACIPTYQLASGLIANGMNWWQSLLTILLGNVIVLAPILLNSHPGTKYGIPFPVFARASYGVFGSNLPALMRAVVACGWFGIQAWIGGQALDIFFQHLIPNWETLLGPKFEGHPPTRWLSFGLFWGLNVLIIFKGMDLLKKVAGFAAPFVIAMTGLLCLWAVNKANGLGYLMHETGKFNNLGEFLPVFIPSLTAMIGFWATLSLNMPDFTRFGRSQREQTIGQVVALPTAMTLFSAMSVIITSAAIVIYPQSSIKDLWDPLKLIGMFDEAWLIAIAMFTAAVATLSVNIAANVVSPANDFANAFPKWISFRTGGLITGLIGILMQPWRLIEDPHGYVFIWLNTISGGLGSIAGVMIADYWLIRKKQLQLPDLYLTEGAYTYTSGWNWRAVVATVIGCTLACAGVSIKELKPLYDYGFFVGFGVSFILYFALMKACPPANVQAQPSPAE
jgi:nucleobase:cation symporter-1, NCS1 family